MIIDVKDRTHSEAFCIAQEAAITATKQQILRERERRNRIAVLRTRAAMNKKRGFIAATEARDD